MSVQQQIDKLALLHKSGVINEEEFISRRSDIIDGFVGSKASSTKGPLERTIRLGIPQPQPQTQPPRRTPPPTPPQRGFSLGGAAVLGISEIAPPSAGIGLFNLPFSTTEAEFDALVGQFPGLQSVRMVTNANGHFKGYAFAYYNSVAAATVAKRGLTGLTLMSVERPWNVDVKFATKDLNAPKLPQLTSAAPVFQLHGGRGAMAACARGGARSPWTPKMHTEAAPSAGIGLFNLPLTTTEAEFRSIVDPFPGLVGIKMIYQNEMFKGYAFAYFDSVEAATVARSALQGLVFGVEEKKVDVKYAAEGTYTPEESDPIKEEVGELYQRPTLLGKRPLEAAPSDGIGFFNLPLTTTEEELTALAEQFPGFLRMQMVVSPATKEFKGVAFAYYDSVENATAALDVLSSFHFEDEEGNPVTVDVKYASCVISKAQKAAIG